MPDANASRSLLQAALVWHGKIIGYRLLRPRGKLTVGASKRCSLVTPSIPEGVGGRFTLVAPARPRGRYRVRLTPAFRGELTLKGEKTTVATLLASPPNELEQTRRRPDRARTFLLEPGDRARLTFSEAHGLRLELRFVDAPTRVPKPRLADTEPYLARITASVAVALAIVVTAAMLLGPAEEPGKLTISKERLARILPPEPLPTATPRGAQQKEEKKAQERAGQAKKAKDRQGKVGRREEIARDTVIPKGEKDILREKVSKVGLLGIIGRERPQGSGLAKLFSDQTMDLEQAVAGMTGQRLVAGRGSAGLATTGAGVGGGGTGDGRIFGAGELDTGGRSARGRGRGGPALAARKEREVKVDIATGAVDEGGGLTKEQVAKVVRAHQNAIKFCYEKELQRKPNLSGKIDVYWVIVPDGSVEKSRIAGSTMEDTAVEGCIVRQVKQWTFPRSEGRTVVQSFPFLFKGGV
jgi:hypothetical protein